MPFGQGVCHRRDPGDALGSYPHQVCGGSPDVFFSLRSHAHSIVERRSHAILLLPLLAFVYGISRDRELMGEHATGRIGAALSLAVIGMIAVCIVALLGFSL